MKYIVELLVVMSLFINQIQFLLFSLMGIEYDQDSGTGLVAIVNVCFFAICILWVTWKSLRQESFRKVHWPYVLTAFIIFLFFFESALTPELTFNSFAGKQFIFFGVTSVPAIFLATFIYKFERFDMITRNMDLIMLICTLALALNLPKMLILGSQTIGGSGGHQEISYNAAFCFSINLTNLMSGNTENRFSTFNKGWFKALSLALLPLQAIICVFGGGRGGGVLLVFSFMAIMFIYARKHFVKTMLLGIIALALFVVISSQFDLFSDGFGRTFNYFEGGKFSLENDQSDIERTMLRTRSFAIISDSPIYGHGLWNGLIVAGYYMHNIFLDILIAGGLLFLLLFLFIMKRVYASINKMLLQDNRLCMILPLCLFPTTMLMFSGYYITNSLFWFCSVFALLWRREILQGNIFEVGSSMEGLCATEV